MRRRKSSRCFEAHESAEIRDEEAISEQSFYVADHNRGGGSPQFMMGNFTLGGVGSEPSAANLIHDEIQSEQHRFFIQQIMSAEDQRTQVMNSSALRFHISDNNNGEDTPEGLETQKMYHHIPPYVSDLESS